MTERRIGSNATEQGPNGRTGLGCGQTGCLVLSLIFLIFLLASICSDSGPSYDRNRDDEVLTDEEFENKPYDELSEQEKKQAVDRIGKDLGADDGK